MPAALHFTDDPKACTLLAEDPFALLVGFAIDQQVTVQKAFAGPYVLKERAGTLDPRKLATMDLAEAFAGRVVQQNPILVPGPDGIVLEQPRSLDLQEKSARFAAPFDQVVRERRLGRIEMIAEAEDVVNVVEKQLEGGQALRFAHGETRRCRSSEGGEQE